MNRRKFLRSAALAAAGAPFWLEILNEDAYAKLPSGIRITKLRTFLVKSWVFVKVYTNKGVVGLGEGAIAGREASIAAAIKELEHYIVGKDPTAIEFLWQAMYRWPRWRGGGPILNSAVSAIEIALWDILGKLLDVPIYQLLGGAARNRIRVYIHGTGGEAVSKAKAHGLTAIKTGPPVGKGVVVKRPWNLRRAAALIEEMREAAGDDFDIMTDAHGKLNPVMALEYANAIEPYRVMFLEEPIQVEDLDMLAWLGNRTKVPLAMGERQFTKFGFKEMISRHLVSYVQPDVVHAGGILETKKIAAMAEAHFIDVALHNHQSLVNTLASLHVDACTPNCVIQERGFWIQNDWLNDLFYGVEIPLTDGYSALPDKPGLGCDLDEEVAAKYPYEPGYRAPIIFEDGSVFDS